MVPLGRNCIKLCCVALLCASAAFAQDAEPITAEEAPATQAPSVEVKAAPKPRPKPAVDAGTATPTKSTVPSSVPIAAVVPAADAGTVTAPTGKPPAQQFLAAQVDEADLVKSWAAWRQAFDQGNGTLEKEARQGLLAARNASDVPGFEAFAFGWVRAASAREASGDATAAVELSSAAVEIAPTLPTAHFSLAASLFAAAPDDVSRWGSALWAALGSVAEDPRFARASMGDFGAAVIFAWVFTVFAVIWVMFFRRARCFFHDVSASLPGAVAGWLSTTLGLVLLLVPIVFRMGGVPSLLAVFLAFTFYVSTRERAVAALLITSLAFVPMVGEALTARSVFGGTPAEVAYVVEQAGPGTEVLAASLADKVKAGQAEFPEAAALGHYYLHRGKLELAQQALKAALAIKPQDPVAMNNLATALFLSGDIENPKTLYEDAAKTDLLSGAALHNLAHLYKKRLVLFGDTVAAEADKALASLRESRERDPSLASRADPDPTKPLLSSMLVTVSLPQDMLFSMASKGDSAERVGSQLSLLLMGEFAEDSLALIYPGFLALLVFGLGFLGTTLAVARSCQKCGRSFSRRSEPNVAKGSKLCVQCINVFVKKGVVSPTTRLRKQIEVARHTERQNRWERGLGLVFTGMGHVFAGAPIIGSILGFFFLLIVSIFVFRYGVLRAPYGGIPLVVKLVPLGILFVTVHSLSLRRFFKKNLESGHGA